MIRPLIGQKNLPYPYIKIKELLHILRLHGKTFLCQIFISPVSYPFVLKPHSLIPCLARSIISFIRRRRRRRTADRCGYTDCRRDGINVGFENREEGERESETCDPSMIA